MRKVLHCNTTYVLRYTHIYEMFICKHTETISLLFKKNTDFTGK